MKPSKVFSYSAMVSVLLVAYLFDHSTTPALVRSTWLVAALLSMLCCILPYAQHLYILEKAAARRFRANTFTTHYPNVTAFRDRAGL